MPLPQASPPGASRNPTSFLAQDGPGLMTEFGYTDEVSTHISTRLPIVQNRSGDGQKERRSKANSQGLEPELSLPVASHSA